MDIDFLKNKKALVTGGNGFIGSHMVSRLIKSDCAVFAMIRDTSDVWRLEEVRDSINLIKLDIRDSEVLSQWLAKI
ncbi:MAG: SDR family NAD(P)-dependent oxidoreductase, partial [Clostridiaceae bacterium]|nr:SDR family NAD(P)-dependent oxidoreductase [Clostridiaceae bacterium]